MCWAPWWLTFLAWAPLFSPSHSAALNLNGTLDAQRVVVKSLRCKVTAPDLSLMLAFGHFDPQGVGDPLDPTLAQGGYIAQLQGQFVSALYVHGRPRQLQVLNSTTMGYLRSTDFKSNNCSYCFIQISGRMRCVPLIGNTPDAHFNTGSQTIFYLSAQMRPAETACTPFYEAGEILYLERLIEASPTGETLWMLPVETVLCHKPLDGSRSTKPFQLNTVLYLHHEGTILVTSQSQGTMYKVRRHSAHRGGGSRRHPHMGCWPAWDDVG